jgi:hypothetical protein
LPIPAKSRNTDKFMSEFFTPTDGVFLLIVLWIAIYLINGGGGGHKARVPAQSAAS